MGPNVFKLKKYYECIKIFNIDVTIIYYEDF